MIDLEKIFCDSLLDYFEMICETGINTFLFLFNIEHYEKSLDKRFCGLLEIIQILFGDGI
jgi:hypothetical protein